MPKKPVKKDYVTEFMSSLRGHGNLEAMFDLLPDVYFYIKDKDCRFVLGNEATLRLFNLKSNSELIGKTEYDFFPDRIADPIQADDCDVIRNDRKIINHTELIVDEAGHLIWVSTNKLPLFGRNGSAKGLMGTTRVLRRSDRLPEGFHQFAPAIERIQKDYSEAIDVEELAKMSSLSSSQFRKRFKELFRLPPQQFIQKVRLQAACHLLDSTDDPLSEIALKCGFCDQSYFTRQFRSFFDTSPKRYRERWRRRR